MAIVLATARPEALTGFAEGLAKESGQDVAVAPDGKTALDRVASKAPALVVIDEGLPDHKPLDLVREIMMVSAMTLTAVVTSMSEEQFHEEAEGYGVLMPLPTTPGAQDGVELAKRMSGI
ncbi:Response regulator receiver domain protein [Pseudodesulfovibrio hydrargyri]|uniref:Response regulator receiver domain protein n=1 Tax=Pseudodesulfovibrio hydrargyri TaxID=2125990 RepID=A0A1J5N544_9BACT|nr:response regulator transcription factor [Pseudodesulfovibrio hydrargyri]OIQ49968.1 Response regulator receiver domain protein [Pseudodesulfovibrio hydrargyri]